MLVIYYRSRGDMTLVTLAHAAHRFGDPEPEQFYFANLTAPLSSVCNRRVAILLYSTPCNSSMTC